MRNKLMLFVLAAGLMIPLSGCGEPKPQLNRGEIIQIIKHDDVEEKVCTKKKTTRAKVNGTWKTTKVCVKYKSVEVSPEWYEFELRDDSKTGWTNVDEDTGESYKVGDQYP